MKRITKFFLFMTLVIGMLILGAQVASAEDRVYYDSTNKIVTYTSLDFSIEEKGKLFVAAYSNGKLAGLSAKNVGVYHETVSIDIDVTEKPTTVKAFVFDGNVNPLSSSVAVESTNFIDSKKRVTLYSSKMDWYYNGTTGIFEYLLNDSTDVKELEIDTENLMIFYNGEKLDETEIDTMGGINSILSSSNIMTFDGLSKGVYSEIYVTDYFYGCVDSISVNNLLIKLTSGAISLSDEDRGSKFVYNLYDENGNEILLGDIQKNDVLNIVAPISDDGYVDLDAASYMDIYVTRNSFDGVVSEEIISGMKYVINDESYTFSEYAGIYPGYEGTFYLTIDGYISYFKAVVPDCKYAFILACDSESAFGDVFCRIKLFAEDGYIYTCNLASKIKVYEDGYYSVYEQNADKQSLVSRIQEKTSDMYSREEAEAALQNRIIAFETNDDGEISHIIFADYSSNSILKKAWISAGKYNSDTSVFSGYDIAEDAVLFVAPVSNVSDYYGEEIWNVSEEDMWIDSFTNLDENDTYNMGVFGYEHEDYIVSAGVIGEELRAPYSNLAVIKSVSTVLDSENNEVDKYTFIQSGEIYSRIVSYDAGVLGLSVGDVFRYALNRFDEIESVQLIYDMSSGTFNDNGFNYASLAVNERAFVFGNVVECDGTTMRH